MFTALPRRLAARVLRPAQIRRITVVAADDSSSRGMLLAGATAGVAAVATLGYSFKPVLAEGKPDLEERVAGMELAQAGRVSAAFVFIKPHAVTDKVKALMLERFAAEGLAVLSEGCIRAETIDKDMLIDTHYGAIANRAMKQKPAQLVVQAGAQANFEKAFGLKWADALAQGKVYNLVDAAEKLGCSMSDVGGKYDKLKKDVDLIKFGGGFYCGKVEGIFVINGFYARMRSQFTTPGTSIYYYSVEWDPARLSWADFRGKVLGGTDPKTADSSSVRNTIFRTWQDLGLASEPNTGENGVHASASPFEALSERANWLGVPLERDFFCRGMLAAGVPITAIKAWCDDPAVMFEGKKQSLFDLLEDLDGRNVLKKSAAINASN